MAVEIILDEQTYTLDFNRKQAVETIKKLNSAEDIFTSAKILIGDSFKKNHSDLTEEYIDVLTNQVCEDYPITDRVEEVVDEKTGESTVQVVAKGLFSVLQDIVQGVIPKGFTQNAPKKAFKVL